MHISLRSLRVLGSAGDAWLGGLLLTAGPSNSTHLALLDKGWPCMHTHHATHDTPLHIHTNRNMQELSAAVSALTAKTDAEKKRRALEAAPEVHVSHGR
jgi:hypothetical protein